MKAKTSAKLKLKTYDIISRAVEEGIAYGYNRAYKHTDQPDESYLKEQISIAVMGALTDVIIFDDYGK